MAKRITVVLSQGQSIHPAKRKLEEDLVAQLVMQGGVDVTVVPNLYDLTPDGTGMLCLSGIVGDMIVLAWLFPRAAHWTLDRYGIRGQIGQSLLKSADEEDDEEDDRRDDPVVARSPDRDTRGGPSEWVARSGDRVTTANEGSDDESSNGADAMSRVIDHRPLPHRKIYCLDLRTHDAAGPYLEEIRRIAAEATTKTVDLMSWIGGAPKQAQLDRYLNPAGGNGSGNGHARQSGASPGNGRADNNAAPMETSTLTSPPPNSPASNSPTSTTPAPTVIAEDTARRWYPVIDYSRCTNCMECIDFCLFGVYGVDRIDTILVEQPDNCRKGCPACSRVCPENAIMFPQHKTPAIAGSMDVAGGGLKIDLSQLFGGPDGKSAVDIAAVERDEQLVAAGRNAVGLSVGIPKRQTSKPQEPKDELDCLMDALDDLEL